MFRFPHNTRINHYNLQTKGGTNARNDLSPTHTGPAHGAVRPIPICAASCDGRRKSTDPFKHQALLDRWYESEILFGSPRCWGCCTQTEQRVILIGLLSDAA